MSIDELPAPTRGFKKKERTRRRLLDAGVRAYARAGAALTVQQVAEEAGVSHGTFYNYFRDLDAFIDAVAMHVLLELLGAFARDAHADPAVRFATTSLRLLAELEGRPALARVLVRLSARPEHDGLVTQQLRADLHEGAAAGAFPVEVDDILVDQVTGALFLAVRHLAAGRWPAGRATATVERLLLLLGVSGDAAVSLVADAARSVSVLPPAESSV